MAAQTESRRTRPEGCRAQSGRQQTKLCSRPAQSYSLPRGTRAPSGPRLRKPQGGEFQDCVTSQVFASDLGVGVGWAQLGLRQNPPESPPASGAGRSLYHTCGNPLDKSLSLTFESHIRQK